MCARYQQRMQQGPEGHPLLESSQSQVAIFYGLVMNNVGAEVIAGRGI